MDEEDFKPRRFYAVSYKEDIPRSGRGVLIPYQSKKLKNNLEQLHQAAASILVPLAGLLFFVGAGLVSTTAYTQGYLSLPNLSTQTASLPAITVLNNATGQTELLSWGAEPMLSQPSFFSETRDAFILAGTTFIEADLAAMELRYFDSGVLKLQLPIAAKGKPGSWWQTPAGLYEIEFKKERHFSSIGQVFQPWSMAFQGNFFIHGWPEYPSGQPVPEGFSGGCIRLSNEDAKQLYQLVKPGIPILVHDVRQSSDTFLYEPRIPDLETPHYLIADVDNGAILAASDLEAVVPIASVTKLMTAIIAAEYINLDSSVSINQPTFVQSLIPRLGERSRVSMYSLLQLLLVESSNEAAEVIAAQLGRDRFISHMNEKARSLGMTKTNFADPSGLSAENTSSLFDLYRLSQYLHTNRSFILELTANQNLPTAYTSGDFGELVNFNLVDGTDSLIGGKVGETLAAGQTSLTLHRFLVRDVERTIAVIILGSDNRNADVLSLLNYARERFGR
jgi:hypothetical protein